MKRSNNSFTAPRLTGEVWRSVDKPLVESFFSEPQIHQTPDISRLLGRWDLASWLLDNQQHFERFGYGMMTLRETDSKEVIGHIGLLRNDNTMHPELTFAIHPKLWGQGFATEAVGALTRYARRRLKLERIDAIVHPDSAVSQRVLLKNGYQEIQPMLTPHGTELLVFQYARSCG